MNMFIWCLCVRGVADRLTDPPLPHSQLTVGFCDPSTLETNPGWPLRNFLMLVAQQW